MSTFKDAERDAQDLAKLVNEYTKVTTRYGSNPKKSWLVLQSEFESDSAAAILELNKSRGFRIVGAFSTGFTYELANDVGTYDDGLGNPDSITRWIYSDASVFDNGGSVTVTAGTIPSAPTYTQVVYNDATNINLENERSVQEDFNFTYRNRNREPAKLFVRPASGSFLAQTFIEQGDGAGRIYNAPFTSVGSALIQAQVGDTVYVMAGGYSGNVTFKEGVKIVCEEGVVFYNSIFTLTDINGFELYGYPKLVKTDLNATLFNITNCKDYHIEIQSVENWRPNGVADQSRGGINSVRSSGDLIIRDDSFTLNKQYITIDNEWSDEENVINLYTRGNDSQRNAANSNNTDVQPLGVVDGATVNWYVSGEQKSDLNNCVLVGQITAPPSAKTTRLNIISQGALFNPSTGTFLIRGDTVNNFSINDVDIQGVTRHRGSEFARNGNTTSVNSTLRIFGDVYSNNADTAFETTPVETITVTAEA